MEYLPIVSTILSIAIFPVTLLLWRLMGKVDNLPKPVDNTAELREIISLLKEHALTEELTQKHDQAVTLRILDRIENNTSRCLREGHQLKMPED